MARNGGEARGPATFFDSPSDMCEFKRLSHTLLRMKMAVLRFDGETEYNVVIGPCLGCESWQFDYTFKVAQSYATWVVSEYSDNFDPAVDMRYWADCVENVLLDHYDECRHLQALVEEHLV